MKPNKSLSSPTKHFFPGACVVVVRLSFQQEDLYSYVTVVDGPTNEGTKVVDDV